MIQGLDGLQGPPSRIFSELFNFLIFSLKNRWEATPQLTEQPRPLFRHAFPGWLVRLREFHLRADIRQERAFRVVVSIAGGSGRRIGGLPAWGHGHALRNGMRFSPAARHARRNP
jgi:hypothetical protein